MDDMSDQKDSLPCQDKMVFDSQAQAEANALAVQWQQGEDMVAYSCQYCRLWHLSTNRSHN